MNNRREFGALFASDIKLITANLFVGARQFILILLRSLVYTSTAFLASIKQLQNFSSCMCLYLELFTVFVAPKVSLGGKSCSKLLKTVKVATKLPSTI